MTTEFDHDLTPEQWETLKTLRLPAREGRKINRFTADQLVGLGLAAFVDGMPSITPSGRKVLIRGSSRLLDLAA